MREFFRGLGKFVRGLLNKIRKPKKQEYESVSSIFGAIDTGTKEFNKIDDNGLVMIPSCADANFELVYDEDDLINELEKFVSIHRTLLPKRYRIKTLIVTLAANQEYDYQAVDFSQYEEKGLAHYIVGSTKSPEELDEQYQTSNFWDEESNGQLWFDDGTCSAIVGAATLLHYEELGIWEVEY